MKKSLNLKNERPLLFGSLIILVVVFVLFIFANSLRSDRFGVMRDEHHHHLTGSSIVFTENWLRENPFKLGFKMYHTVRSIETPTEESMMLYDSYPPGTIIPFYVLAKITGSEHVTPAMVMGYNVFNHFMVALMLAIAVFVLLHRNRFNYIASILFGILTATLVLFFVACQYFFQNVFFSDQAVLMYFAALILLETYRGYRLIHKRKKLVDILIAIVIFAGVFTDWLFIFILAVLYCKRLLEGDLSGGWISWFKKSFMLGLPAIVAVGLYGLQLVTNGSDRFYQKLLERTGQSDVSGWTEIFPQMFWGNYIPMGFGEYAKFLIFAALIFVATLCVVNIAIKVFKKEIPHYLKDVLGFSALVVLPCFIQIYFFKNHSAIHDFSTLKMSFVLSAVSFAILPATIFMLLSHVVKKARVDSNIYVLLPVILIVFASVYLVQSYPRIDDMIPPETPDYNTMGYLVGENTGYNDIVFSNDWFVNYEMHSKMYASFKQIHSAYSEEDIFAKIEELDIRGDYVINILEDCSTNNNEGLQALIDIADEVIETVDDETGKTFRLYKLEMSR